MGRIARVIEFFRTTRGESKISQVKSGSGSGWNTTNDNFQPAGDDAFPLSTDYEYIGEVDGSGRYATLNYADPINTPKAEAGDKRIYARDASSGLAKVDVWLKADGTLTIENEAGKFELTPDGVFTINEATITADGDVITNTGVSLRHHKHIGNLGSPTGEPLPGGG